MWGTRARQRLRLAPLYSAVAIADCLSALPLASRPITRMPPSGTGISVVIPDRDAPALLAAALDSVEAALAALGEPHEIIVVANGAPRLRYAAVAERHPKLELVHDPRPCGFSTAIDRGLQRARHDWTLLLNNDMTLEPRALDSLVALRAPDVFAIAPQILQISANGRREETGFVDWYIDGSGIHVYHAPVPRDDASRPHLCASGGAGLFRTVLLRRYVREARAYDPFYWEDVEWGLRAQREGFRVLYCPAAKAKHRHRATTARFYAPEEIERIVERNRLLFDLRNAVTPRGANRLLEGVCDQPYASQRELATPRVATQVLRHRWRSRRMVLASPPPVISHASGEVIDHRSSFSYSLGGGARTRVLLVTPFCIFPPRHGGARRLEGLLQRLRQEFDVALVSDEATLYDLRSFTYFDGLQSVQLVQRSELKGANEGADLEQRMSSHCHAALMRVVCQALRRYRPHIVQIEHVELAALSRLRTPGQRWILGLHDAYSASDFREQAAAERLHRHVLETYDAVTVCSPEDQALLAHPRTVCVPNGAGVGGSHHSPSQSSQLLFMGPFRYTQNLQGIRQFLRDAYPRIKAAVPAARLLVLAGDGAEEAIAGDDAFRQDGVSVVGHRDEVGALLRDSAVTINPLSGIRGSSVKVIESLAAGRACVSTKEGARGFLDAGFSGLITTTDVAAMAEPIIDLLDDAELRHRIEMPDAARLEPFQWQHCAGIQAALYGSLLDARHG
jgi:GT2 family glycosyltransferase/glycosyltransferase involved in cell wall biosynthesis